MKTYLVSETYETITPESAEYGDVADSGFILEKEEMTAREILNHIKQGGYIYFCKWFSTESYVTEYATGETQIESLYINSPMDPRILNVICKMAGIRKF